MDQENKQSCLQDTSLPDLEALKGQLEHREALKIKAEQLRESTLSRIKAREKATRRLSSRNTTPGDKPSDDSPTGPTTPLGRKHSATNSAVKEKSNLLKRKLEEARARLESQRGQESLGKANEVVESIRVQLEDREKVIQELLTIHSAKPVTEPETVETEPDIPDAIKQKILDLEAQVLDLQENLKEKDSVISARTQAITLLSEDMARKSKVRLDNLEETQEQMRQMQRNFIVIEERMKEEQQKLKEHAEERKQKCLQAEKNLRLVEATRFELSTRVAELQEKVVALQEKNIEFEQAVETADSKQNEMKEALDAANKLAIKMKAQFKVKMKALEEERDALKKLGEGSDEISKLQNRVAELEEEKGNLQLSLVDFDEQQELCNTLKNRVEELESKIIRQDGDLDSHVKALTQLETEKLDLLQAAQQLHMMLAEKDALIDRLQHQLSEVERMKVSAEMRAVELEEKLDLGIKEQRRAQSEEQDILENMRNEMVKYEETVRELQDKLADRPGELLETDNKEKVMQSLTSELEEWKQKYFEMEAQYNSINEVYHSLETRVAHAERQNELVVTECNQLRVAVSDLESTVARCNSASNPSTDSPNKEEGHLPKSDEVSVTAIRTEDLHRHGQHANSDVNKDNEIERLRGELTVATEEIHRLNSTIENLNTTSVHLDDLNRKIEEKDKTLEHTCNELEKRTRKLSEYKKFHKLKSEDVLRVSHELETVTASSQQRIFELETELAKSQEIVSELQTKIPEQKMKKLAASLKLKAKACKDFEAKLVEAEKRLEENSVELKRLMDERDDAVKCIEEKQNIIENLTSTENRILSEVSELKSWVTELQSQLTCKAYEITLLTNQLNENNISVEEKIREGLKRNEMIFSQMEMEVASGKAEIGQLKEKLGDVTMRYNRACTKVQEKEAYIETLEADLLKNRERVQLIESSLEERRKSLEEKAEVLGVRLLNAETANQQIEKYEGELERQLAFCTQNESFLQKSLVDMKHENGELKNTVSVLTERNECLEKETDSSKNSIRHLQNELIALRELQEVNNHNLEELDRLNNENKHLKGAKEKLIANFEEREKQVMENMEEELKLINQKTTFLESDRQELFSRLEQLNSENTILKEELQTYKASTIELRILEAEIEKYKKMCSNLQNDIILYEERANLVTRSHIKDVDGLLAEQNRFMQKKKTEFENKESCYIDKIKEIQEYNTKLIGSLEIIEKNAENLKSELERVGMELDASKKELIALRLNQNKSADLQSKLIELKENYDELLSKERVAAENLKVELLREKAKKEIDRVVMEAENKVDLMTQQTQLSAPLFTFPGTNSDIEDVFTSNSSKTEIQPVAQESLNHNELEQRLRSTLEENERLLALVDSYESNLQVKVTKAESCLDTLQSFGGRHHENKDEEDGWGWGGEELMSEHGQIKNQHPHVSTAPDYANQRLIELEQKLKDYETENIRLSEELKESQVRCGKLLKKAKELKVKSENLERGSREKSVGFEDLNFAMQEELRNKIDVLEKNLSEALNDGKNWKAEKESYLRRIDTLTIGNERFAEMKDRQDIEVAMWQKQNAELKHHIQGLEWKIEELEEEDHGTFSRGSSEMEEKLNSLAAENEQLVKVLNEMKEQQLIGQSRCAVVAAADEGGNVNNRLQALVQENEQIKRDRNEIKDLYDEMQKNLEDLSKQNTNLLNANEDLNSKFDTFKIEINELALENENLKTDLTKYEDISLEYSAVSAEFQKIRSENDYKINLLSEENRLMKGIVSTSEEQLKEYQKKLDEYKNNLEVVDFNYKRLKEELSSVSRIEESSRNVVARLELENSVLKSDIENLKKQQDNAKEEIKLSNTKFDEQIFVLQEKEKSLEKVKEENPVSSGPVLFRGFATEPSGNDPFLSQLETMTKEEATKHSANYPFLVPFEDTPKTETRNPAINDPFSIPFEEVILKDDAVKPLLEASSASVVGSPISKAEDVQRLKEQISTLNTLLQEKETELELTKISVDSFKLERENLHDEWSKKYEDLKSENISANEITNGKFQEALNTAKQNFQDSLLLKEEEIAHLTCELSAKEQLLMNNVNGLHSAQNDVEIITNRLKEVENDLERTTFENESLRQELCCLRDEYTKLQQRLAEKEQDVLVNGANTSDSSKEIEILKTRLGEVESELEQAVSSASIQKESQQLEINNLCKECLELQKNLSDSKAEFNVKLEEANTNLSKLKCEYDECIRILEERNETISVMERNYSDCYNSYQESQNTIHYLQENLKELGFIKQQFNECCNSVQISQNTIASLEEKLKDFESVKNQLDNAYMKIEELSKPSNSNEKVDPSLVISKTDETCTEQRHTRSAETQQATLNTSIEDEVLHYKEMIRLRDIEIERLMQVVGEAEEQLIQAEEAKLSSNSGVVNNLQSRLDEVLYTLHLRDVRCEELTLELMQLLEERDGLQLRLSAAIQQNEKSRGQLEQSPGKACQEQVGIDLSGSDNTDSASENNRLHQKLGELHSVGYTRDLSVQQERERRYTDQMHLYSKPHTHHDDDDIQQQSSQGLLGWLFGTK